MWKVRERMVNKKLQIKWAYFYIFRHESFYRKMNWKVLQNRRLIVNPQFTFQMLGSVIIFDSISYIDPLLSYIWTRNEAKVGKISFIQFAISHDDIGGIKNEHSSSFMGSYESLIMYMFIRISLCSRYVHLTLLCSIVGQGTNRNPHDFPRREHIHFTFLYPACFSNELILIFILRQFDEKWVHIPPNS